MHVSSIATLLHVQAVFDRVWRHWKSGEELKHRNKLAAIFDSPSPPKRLPTFNEVIIKSQAMLEKVMSGWSTAFLLEASQSVCEKLHTERRATNERSSGSSVVPQTLLLISPAQLNV